MKNVLLVIEPGYEAPDATAYALSQARERGASLIALAVLDPGTHQRVASTLSNVGFVGGRVREGVVDALEKERRTFAEMQLQQIAEEAQRQRIECETIIREGETSEVCAGVVSLNNVSLAVLVAEKRSWVTRFLSRSATVKLPNLAGCEVKVMEG